MLKTFKTRNQKTKKCQVIRIPNGEIITWKISLKIKQVKRYPLIHTKLKMSNSQREDGSKQTKLSTKFHDGTKYQNENGLPSTNTHLIRIARLVFYRK